MAFQFYVTIEGAKQGTFKGDAVKVGGASSARIGVLTFNYAVTTPHDPATGQASGKRQHSPVSFTKSGALPRRSFTSPFAPTRY
jgi:type VI secretion system secreted protein Hcp